MPPRAYRCDRDDRGCTLSRVPDASARSGSSAQRRHGIRHDAAHAYQPSGRGRHEEWHLPRRLAPQMRATIPIPSLSYPYPIPIPSLSHPYPIPRASRSCPVPSLPLSPHALSLTLSLSLSLSPPHPIPIPSLSHPYPIPILSLSHPYPIPIPSLSHPARVPVLSYPIPIPISLRPIPDPIPVPERLSLFPPHPIPIPSLSHPYPLVFFNTNCVEPA